METLYLNEMLRILFLSYQKHPRQFYSLFNDSSSIAAFDFDIAKEEFVGLSQSFGSFLGTDKFLCEVNALIFNQLVHPNDLLDFKEYFNLSSPLANTGQNTNTFIFKRMKCRLRHSNGYWKYFIFISFNKAIENSDNTHKIGFIVEEVPFPGIIQIGERDTHYISDISNESNTQLHITKRENEILEYIGQGMIAKEIAQKLNISVTTVISHRKNLINKFHVKNTAELIRQASRLMIV